MTVIVIVKWKIQVCHIDSVHGIGSAYSKISVVIIILDNCVSDIVND